MVRVKNGIACMYTIGLIDSCLGLGGIRYRVFRLFFFPFRLNMC